VGVRDGARQAGPPQGVERTAHREDHFSSVAIGTPLRAQEKARRKL
jgi:hypothetical protein